MIIVKLKGGLGNQLFQYAMARRLAYVNNVPLKLDIVSGYENDDHGRKYCLNNLNIQEDVATLDEVFRIIKKGRIRKKLFKLFERKFKPYHKRHYLIERHYKFDPVILNIRATKRVYLDGYWQSEKYFKDIEDIIRREFKVRYEPYGKNQLIIQQILNCNSVSLHIRRGDNVTHQASKKIYKVPSMEYYNVAVEKLKESLQKPHFFIFSDDLEWAQKNMKLSYQTTFVTHNGDENNYEDLRLMSFCKHHIIANSSFSWWGAWLSDYSHKIVIAPEEWVKKPFLHIQNKDLIPSSWIRI